MAITDLITRKYSNFRGVDFTGGIVSDYRSPDALNMWKNYKDDDCIQTRPGMTLLNNFDSDIYGLFFYTVNGNTQVLLHLATKMYRWTNYPTVPAITTEIYTGLNPKESRSFVYDNIFFFMDGVNYLEYDGINMKKVEGTVPVTSYYKNPDGSVNLDESTDFDTVNQPVNLLTPKRINMFIADGVSKNYQLDIDNLDSAVVGGMVVVTIKGVHYTENESFTVDRIKGIVKFNSVPTKGDIVEILFSRSAQGYRQRIENCTLNCEFDNRIFFSGNKDYPNSVFHSELEDPRYVSDIAYQECGLDLSLIKCIMPGNNVLWVFKEINQNTSSVYYLTPTLNQTYNKIYPANSGSISLGCVSTGINFNDDIVFFSNKGLEGITSTALYSEQVLGHRSSLIDNKLLSEPNYKDIKLAEYDGYLFCLINSHLYLADSRSKFQNISGDIEYEWFYWEIPFNITYIKEYRGKLYLANNVGQLFVLDGLTDNTLPINSYWTTKQDDFGYPGYTKTTNKRGGVAYLKTMNNDAIEVKTIVDYVTKDKGVFEDTRGYIAYRIKDKKFKKIQIKISSKKPFGLFSCTIQGFIAGYIKR